MHFETLLFVSTSGWGYFLLFGLIQFTFLRIVGNLFAVTSFGFLALAFRFQKDVIPRGLAHHIINLVVSKNESTTIN